MSIACVSPPELEDRRLLTYLDDEEDPQVVAHLEQCPHCRERTRRLAQLHNRLTAQLYRVTCPAPVELGEYHLDVLPREQRAAVAEHLAECPHCTREVAQLKEYLGELVADLEFSPLERVKVLVADLVRGSREIGRPAAPALAPAYAGLRGGDEGPCLYQAGDAQIAIDVQDDAEAPDGKVLLGLVTGVDLRQLKARLWRADQLVAAVLVDELGNFAISHLAPDRYELVLSGPETEIRIQEVVVGTNLDEALSE